MTTVHILPFGLDIEVKPGEAVAEAAWRQGYSWPTKCWGQLDCTQCFVRIKDGEQYILPADEEEQFAMRTRLPQRLRSPLVRLGCRVRVTSEGVVLEKKGVKPPVSPTPATAEATAE